MLELLKFQELVGALKKDATNPHFKKNYSSINAILAEIKPHLTAHKLVILQPIRDGRIYTELYGEKGLLISGNIELPTGLTPQQLGSAITYFRRYSLVSMFALEAEDDDAESTQSRAKPQTVSKQKLTPEIIKAMKTAVAAGRTNDVLTRLAGYEITETQKNEIINGN